MAHYAYEKLLLELYLAIDAKHGLNTLARRENALSPRIEVALEHARLALGLHISPIAKEAYQSAIEAMED